MKVFVHTYGCQMNENDSEVAKQFLVDSGIEIAESEDDADVVVLNTCAVRRKSEEKVYSHIGQLRKKRKLVGVMGCVAEKERERLFARGVSFVVGTRALSRLPIAVLHAMDGKRTMFLEDTLEEIDYAKVFTRSSKHHAWITVIHGCDRFCTYCIVPYVRGRERSRRLEDVLDEVRALTRRGYIEFTFLGQNVDAYGRDLQDGTSLAKLLREASDVRGVRRLWFLTSYPTDFSLDIAHVMAESPAVAKSVHLPVQHGSDRILAAMNRRYKSEEFLDLVERIRAIVPEVSVSSDIIVGFPGETDEDFEMTVELVKRAQFERLNLAIYSPREGTVAWKKLRDDVPQWLKVRRLNYLLNLQKSINRRLNERYVGREVEVIVEAMASTGLFYGRDMRNKIVSFEANEELLGKLVVVKVERVTAGPLYGRIVEVR